MHGFFHHTLLQASQKLAWVWPHLLLQASKSRKKSFIPKRTITQVRMWVQGRKKKKKRTFLPERPFPSLLLSPSPQPKILHTPKRDNWGGWGMVGREMDGMFFFSLQIYADLGLRLAGARNSWKKKKEFNKSLVQFRSKKSAKKNCAATELLYLLVLFHFFPPILFLSRSDSGEPESLSVSVRLVGPQLHHTWVQRADRAP